MNKWLPVCVSVFSLSSFVFADEASVNLRELIEHSDTRDRGMQMAADQGQKSILMLQTMMHDQTLDDDTRIAAHLAMARLGSSVARPILERCLANDKGPYEREASAIALGQLGDSKALPALKIALQDAHGNVRMRAVWAMAKLGDKSGKEVAMSSCDGSDVTAKFLSIEALEAIGDQDVIPRLKRHYSDKQPFNATIAKLAVHRLEFDALYTGERINYLQKALLESEHEVELWAADQLGRLFEQGSTKALAVLKQTLQDDENPAQYAARKEISVLVNEGKLSENQLR